MHRSLFALAAAVALIGPASAGAADPFTKTDIQVVATVGPNNNTQCTVDATIYKPADASAAHPVAAILATNGFGGSKDDFADLAPAYAKRGYAFLAYSGLGFGGPDQDHPDRKGSSCKIELDDPDWDGKAASTMIDYLGGGTQDTDGHKVDYVIQDAVDHAGKVRQSDPRVGMIGGSYGGQVQFAAADEDARLDTIIPQITWNDLAYSLAPNNTAFTFGVTSPEPGTEKYEWTTLFFGIGVAGTGSGSIGSQDPSHFGQCPNFDDAACQTKLEMDSQGYPSAAGMALARHASVSSYMSKITIPTFLAQGQSDTLFNLNEAVATYEALRAQHTPVKMLWKSQGHSGDDLGDSESQDANPEAAYASRAYLEWFDYYLRGIGDPPALDFSYYRDWIKVPSGKDAAPAIGTAPAYPAADDQTLYLSGTDALVGAASAIKAGAPSYQFTNGAATSYTETSAVDQSQAPSDGPGTFVSFTSPALTKDTDVVGIPKLTGLSLSAQAHENFQDQDPGFRLVLFAKLFELKADGTQVLVHRLIAPVRVPDVTKPFDVTLPGIVHRFAKGSKFQLVIAASDAAYKNNNLPDQVTVNVDPKKPTSLTIPVLSSAPAAGVSQPAGSGQQPQVAQEAKKNSAASLSKARACKKNRRVIRIHFTGVKKPDRVISRRVTLNGKRIKVGHARVLKIDLRKRKAGTYRIFVVVRSKHGKVRRTARTYRVC